MVGEVLEKVQVIQDSLSGLDCQLGQLQDLSSLVMDTATILSASDCLHQEEARLAQCGSVSASCHVPPPQSRRFLHKTGLEYEGQNPQKGKNWAFKSKSTPSSLLKGFHLVVSGLQPEEDSNEDMKVQCPIQRTAPNQWKMCSTTIFKQVKSADEEKQVRQEINIKNNTFKINIFCQVTTITSNSEICCFPSLLLLLNTVWKLLHL